MLSRIGSWQIDAAIGRYVPSTGSGQTGKDIINFNICTVKPAGYPHSEAFRELTELVGYGLEDLGHSVTFSDNQTFSGARNILVGCHLLDPVDIAAFPDSTIVINTEQIYEDDSPWKGNIFEWAARFETWDYSERNLAKFKVAGIGDTKLLRVGYHRKLEKIPKPKVQDIDVLFYGSMGARRIKIIEDLRARNCTVMAVFNAYGEERDALISRAKIVLNLHHYNSQIFEIVRVFYLMTNSKAVVSEVGYNTSIDSAYVGGILPSAYDALVDNCRQLLDDSEQRKELESAALETIERLPQSALMAGLLG